jgi:AraC-like DNA-binding protein
MRFQRWLEPPLPALTLMVSLDEPLRTHDRRLPQAWIAGLDDRPELVETSGPQALVDLKLTPLGAYTLCGLPLRELTGAVVALDDVFGSAARQLSEELREASDWDTRFDLVEAFLLRRAAAGPSAHPLVARAWLRLHQSAGQLSIGALAADLGCSRRHLSATFHEQVGLPPKTAARLLRFEHVRRRLERTPVHWAEIAYRCGYADQSHLNRDFRDLAGTTPTDFLARLIPDGGAVGDGVTFLQDERRSPP